MELADSLIKRMPSTRLSGRDSYRHKSKRHDNGHGNGAGDNADGAPLHRASARAYTGNVDVRASVTDPRLLSPWKNVIVHRSGETSVFMPEKAYELLLSGAAASHAPGDVRDVSHLFARCERLERENRDLRARDHAREQRAHRMREDVLLAQCAPGLGRGKQQQRAYFQRLRQYRGDLQAECARLERLRDTLEGELTKEFGAVHNLRDLTRERDGAREERDAARADLAHALELVREALGPSYKYTIAAALGRQRQQAGRRSHRR